MATAIEGLLRTSPAANSTALNRWAQGVSVVLGGNPGPPDLSALLRAANLPSGAPFTRWAQSLSQRLDNLVRDGGGISPAELDDLLNLIGGSYQKLPIGDLIWAYLASRG